jgi:hypothetical protein
LAGFHVIPNSGSPSVLRPTAGHVGVVVTVAILDPVIIN